MVKVSRADRSVGAGDTSLEFDASQLVAGPGMGGRLNVKRDELLGLVKRVGLAAGWGFGSWSAVLCWRVLGLGGAPSLVFDWVVL